jgi:3-phosphoshikimate 1-carboxyvinyltransferase
MLRIANPLNEMGASIACNEGKPPVKISPGKIVDNYTYEMPIASAQVKSGIILSALAANKSVTVIEKHPTRNHTERMISHFQGKIESIPYKAGNKISYTPSGLIASKSYEVVGDFSSAAFLIVAGLIAKESNIVIKNVGLNPTRFGLIDVLISMGGFIEIKNQKLTSNEEVGDIYVRSSSLRGISISGDVIPNIIDEIPILSIAAAFADGETSISDAEELRVKESDRLQAISDGLSKININHELFKDGIKIAGSAKDIEVSPEIDSHGDHRIAMSFLIASLRSTNGVFVKDCKNIFTSFPNFIEVMKTLGIGVYER